MGAESHHLSLDGLLTTYGLDPSLRRSQTFELLR